MEGFLYGTHLKGEAETLCPGSAAVVMAALMWGGFKGDFLRRL